MMMMISRHYYYREPFFFFFVLRKGWMTKKMPLRTIYTEHTCPTLHKTRGRFIPFTGCLAGKLRASWPCCSRFQLKHALCLLAAPHLRALPRSTFLLPYSSSLCLPAGNFRTSSRHTHDGPTLEEQTSRLNESLFYSFHKQPTHVNFYTKESEDRGRERLGWEKKGRLSPFPSPPAARPNLLLPPLEKHYNYIDCICARKMALFLKDAKKKEQKRGFHTKKIVLRGS